MSIAVKVVRDITGTPTLLDITFKGRKYQVTYDRDQFVFPIRLPTEVLEILKLYYPHPEKELDIFQDCEIVQGFVHVESGGAAIITTIYTVPVNKRFYFLSWGLCVTRMGVNTTPWGNLYIRQPTQNIDDDLASIQWVVTTVEVQSVVGGYIPAGFPGGSIIRSYQGLNTHLLCHYIGVLKDARS